MRASPTHGFIEDFQFGGTIFGGIVCGGGHLGFGAVILSTKLEKSFVLSIKLDYLVCNGSYAISGFSTS